VEIGERYLEQVEREGRGGGKVELEAGRGELGQEVGSCGLCSASC